MLLPEAPTNLVDIITFLLGYFIYIFIYVYDFKDKYITCFSNKLAGMRVLNNKQISLY